ncbi:LysR family transcriptional regulator [Oligella ureolytica]
MNFDLYDFRLLLNIAETKSLTKAAEKSFLSTPAASNRIKNLEEQLDLKLLIRLPHGVELTEVGEICFKVC